MRSTRASNSRNRPNGGKARAWAMRTSDPSGSSSRGGAREQDAAVARKRHDARGGSLGQSLDLKWLGATGDILGRVLAQHDFAYVDADARHHSGAVGRAQVTQFLLVGDREAHRLDGPLEKKQESVALVDLAAIEGS